MTAVGRQDLTAGLTGVWMEAGTKENVVFLGLQKIPRGTALVLVNNQSGSTVTYDPDRHNIINMDGYVRFALGVLACSKS